MRTHHQQTLSMPVENHQHGERREDRMASEGVSSGKTPAPSKIPHVHCIRTDHGTPGAIPVSTSPQQVLTPSRT